MSEESSQSGPTGPAPKQGPANPAAGDLDRPTPPGGPQRQDAADTDEVPQPVEKDLDAVRDTDPAPRDDVEENAETSLDQPSDGSGGE